MAEGSGSKKRPCGGVSLKKKALVIGAGLLGKKLLKELKFRGWEAEGTSLEGGEFLRLDIRNAQETNELVKKLSPETVFLAAALTNVDYCEENPTESREVNVKGTENVVNVCRELGCWLVFLSTDYVFDGEKGNYKEEDAPNPLNEYGKAKLDAEKIVSGMHPNLYIIARTSTLYGFNSGKGKKTFLDWVKEELGQGKEIRAVDDQVTSPTLTDDAANALVELVEREKNGLFHVTGSGAESRHGFALKAAEVFGLDKEKILKAKTAELGQKAKRPKDCSLSISRLNSLGIGMRGTGEGIKEVKRQMKEKGLN